MNNFVSIAFFRAPQTEITDKGYSYAQGEAKQSLLEYIEVHYNRSHMGYISPESL